jgi:hypothetical protein
MFSFLSENTNDKQLIIFTIYFLQQTTAICLVCSLQEEQLLKFSEKYKVHSLIQLKIVDTGKYSHIVFLGMYICVFVFIFYTPAPHKPADGCSLPSCPRLL